MIWAGLEVMGEVPFTDVIIHSTVLAADGRRMSKSLGTGVDPLEMIDAHGADATRYGLLKISSTQDVRFSPGAIEEGRKLANKLWNVSRLILQNAAGVEPDARAERARGALDPRPDRCGAEQIEEAGGPSTSRQQRTCSTTSRSTTSATGTPRRSSRDCTSTRPAACATALAALERLLALLHPVMPHVTEEIWSYLPGARDRLIVSPWPAPDDRFGADAAALERVQEAARDLPAKRRAGRARLRRRAPDVRGRRRPGAAESTRRCRPRDRAAAERDRARRGNARERAVRRRRARRPSSRRSAPSSSGTGASWTRSAAPRPDGRWP